MLLLSSKSSRAYSILRHDRARSIRVRAILLASLGGALLACGHPTVGVVGGDDNPCTGSNCPNGAGGSAGASSPGSTAAGGRAPSSDAAAGGNSAVGGGGGAGNGAGAAGAAGAGGASMPTSPTSDMIDNLEDGDGRIRVANGRQGPWHVFNSATNNGGNQKPAFTDTFTPEMGGANGTMYAVHTTGDGYTYAGVGFDLDNSTNVEESPQSQSYSAAGWSGVAFFAKAGSSGSANLRVELSMKQFVPTDRGGSCTGDSCWNVYGSRAIQGQLTPNWQQFKIPFSTLERELGGTTPPFDPTQLMEISFKHEGNNDHFDFWVDEIQFYKDAPPAGGGGNGAGGAGGGGNNGGGSADGGACMIGPAANGSGSYTIYWFGQGTGMDGDGFRTACGYFGHETTPGNGSTDTVENIANPQYFAAIPSNSPMDFNSSKYCGACVEASYQGKSVVATIIDACPTNGQNGPCASNPNGHLDLSLPAASVLGFTVQTGLAQGTTWKFVPCPVNGNVVVRIKPGNPDQVYIENEVLPIATVRMNGANATRLFYGAWQLPGQANGQTLTLTDISGRTITVQVNGSEGQNQMTSAQFPVCSQ